MNDEKLIKKLNQIFKSKKFIGSLMQDENSFSEYIYYKMGRVLEYYIITRDDNLSYTYEEIEQKLGQIDYEKLKNNILDDGFVTHSFNGNKKDIIARYGLDYVSKMPENELEQHQETRKALNELEKILGTSKFVNSLVGNANNSYEKSVFVCTPGAKTFHYACKKSPERLYEGPLKGYEEEPMIVGETKENYFMRVLEKKIIEKYSKDNSKEKEYAMELAKKVIKNYCSSSPAFAMLSLSELKDVQSGMIEYDNSKTESLINRIKRATMYGYKNFFSQNPSDSLETNNLGDLVLNSKEIPMSAISIVECMDDFEMQQIFAKIHGFKEGEYIDYTPNKVKGKPQMSGLITVINKADNIEELNETYEVYKKEILEKLLHKKEKIEEKNGAVSFEVLRDSLENKRKELLNRKREILEKNYLKKDGINSEYGLQEALEEIERRGLKEHLLITDKNIKEDNLQYESDLHGVSHTRRVNFFTTLIMNEEQVHSSTKKIVETIVKNHNIGRINDFEDKEHGNVLEDSIDRLTNMNDDEKEIVKFVIKEHSLSQRENIDDLNSMFETEIQEEYEEKISKMQPWMIKEDTEQKVRNNISKKYEERKKYIETILQICKDGDKLDRVRLDPLGENQKEGLDISRLSLESSKKFENVAYESLDKIIEILDIEHELQDIDREIFEIDEINALKAETEQFNIFEDKINEEKVNRDSKKKDVLGNIVSERRFSKILEIPKKVRQLILGKENKTKRER